MSELPVLDALDQRILGALMEKQVTVPASYPLSLNGLRTACNQASSREPVTDYDDTTIETRLRELKQRGLVRVVWEGKGARTLKYHQLLTDELSLTDAERALLTVLLLRGPQAPGELKTRTERLHAFADRAEVEHRLGDMARRPTPLVTELERRAGQHDTRWAHVLGPVPEAEPALAVVATEIDDETTRALIAAEPVFHQRAVIFDEASFDAAVAPDFEEIGASGHCYPRDQVRRVVLARIAGTRPDSLDPGWRIADAEVRTLGPGVAQVRYTLHESHRITQRSTIYRWTPAGWQVVFHQGTPVGQLPVEP